MFKVAAQRRHFFRICVRVINELLIYFNYLINNYNLILSFLS